MYLNTLNCYLLVLILSQLKYLLVEFEFFNLTFKTVYSRYQKYALLYLFILALVIVYI